MKKLFSKFTAAALSCLMLLSSAMPAMAAEINTIDIPTAIAAGVTENPYTPSNKDVKVKLVDSTGKELADVSSYVNEKLEVGYMGRIVAPTTYVNGGTSLKFSHYQYVTTARNYTASYDPTLVFYVDPPMEIEIVYTAGAAESSNAVSLGMYKNPELKNGNTFFYICVNNAKGANTSVNIDFARSAFAYSSNNDGNVSESFTASKDNNIYEGADSNTFQLIAASAISDSTIDFKAYTDNSNDNVNVRTWDFGTDAFVDINPTTSTEYDRNGLNFKIANTSTTSMTLDGVTYKKGVKLNNGTNNFMSFPATKGDVIYIYGTGGNSNDAILSVTNADLAGGNGNLGKQNGSLSVHKYIASATGTVTINTSGGNGFIYCVKVNPFEAIAVETPPGSSSSTTTEATTETTTQAPQGSDSLVWIGSEEIPSWISFTDIGSGNARTITFEDGVVSFSNDNEAKAAGKGIANNGTITITAPGAGTIKIYASTGNTKDIANAATVSPGTATIDDATVSQRKSTSANVINITVPAAGTYTVTLSGENNGFILYRIEYISGQGGSTTPEITTEATTATTTVTTTKETSTETTTEGSIDDERQNKIDTLIDTLTGYNSDSTKGSQWNKENQTEQKWSYINGCMMTAFMDLYEAEIEDKTGFYDFVLKYQDTFLNSNGLPMGSNNITDNATLDDINPAKAILDLLELDQKGEIALNQATKTKFENCVHNNIKPILDRASRIAEGNFYHKADYPHQVWLDGTYMALPYMIQYERLFDGYEIAGNRSMQAVLEDVVSQFENVERQMRDDKTGLYYHGYDAQADLGKDDGYSSGDKNIATAMSWARKASDTPATGNYKVGTGIPSTASKDGCSSSFWSRAMGWYAMALIDSIEQIKLADPEGTKYGSYVERLSGVFGRLMDAVLNYQYEVDSEGNAIEGSNGNGKGLWYQVMDNPENPNSKYNYIESSGSATFAAALMKGYNLGVLKDKKYYDAGLNAFNALTDTKVENGGLKDICITAGLGGIKANGDKSGHDSKTAGKESGRGRGPKYIYRDGTFDYYVSEELVENDAKGAAPYLMAYAQKLQHDKAAN